MLKEKIEDDLKSALKNREVIKVSTIRFLKAALTNAQIEKRKDLTDEEIIVIIKKQLKQRRDSIEEFKKGNRQDLVDKETEEWEILNAYLPEQLSCDELRPIIEEAVKESQASSLKDMGKAMKEAMSKVKGRADGKLVSDMVKEALSKIAKSDN